MVFVVVTIIVLLVAGTGIEPVSRGYEPRELPLLYPAILFYCIKRTDNETRGYSRYLLRGVTSTLHLLFSCLLLLYLKFTQ